MPKITPDIHYTTQEAIAFRMVSGFPLIWDPISAQNTNKMPKWLTPATETA